MTVCGASPEISFRSTSWACMKRDRLLRVGTKGLLEHDQGESGARRGADPNRGCRVGRPMPAEHDDPPPRPGVALEAPLQRDGQRRASPGRSARPAPRGRRSRPLPSVSPLHFHSEEKGTSARTRSGVARNFSAIASRVRLRSPALAREPRECLLSRRCIGRVGDVDRDELELAGGEGAGLVDADRVHRRQRLGRAHLLDERVLSREPDRGDRERHAHQEDQPLRDQRDQPRGRRLRRLVQGLVARA